MINYKLKIDCQGDKVLSSDISFVSGDVKAYKMTFDFFDGNTPVDTQNCILVIRARRADGSCVEGVGEIIDGKGVYVPENSIYAIAGELRLEVALCDSAKSYITTKIITAEVIEGIGKDTKPAESDISVFVTLFNQVQSKIEEVNSFFEKSLPVRGVDYWTEEDKTQIVNDVLDALPSAEEVAY